MDEKLLEQIDRHIESSRADAGHKRMLHSKWLCPDENCMENGNDVKKEQRRYAY